MKGSLAIVDACKMGNGTMGTLEAAKKSSVTSTGRVVADTGSSDMTCW